MKTSAYKYIVLFGGLGLTIACSTKKDNFVNRNYHALTTKYNVMYNGNNALTAGVADLKTTLTDNYWEVLPVERMQRPVEEMEPTDKRNANFERAETKATKAIQKHSMYIGGSERNPQMDEAHLLLGQSRYYDNRFVPALEAFNYVLYKYPGSSRIDEVKVWREKTNIRLDNDGVAIKNLNQLLKEKGSSMDEQIYSDANAILAQAYIKTAVTDSAVYVLKKAALTSKDNEKKARYNFILGQLYTQLKQPDSAFASYQTVIDMNRKSPRIYVIQSHAMQAGQFDYKKGDTLAFMEKYRDLLKDRENRPFLDVINHQVGLFYDKQELNEKAIEYYNKSLRKKSADKYLTASNYRNIAEIKFEEAKYVNAGKYYDSTMVYMDFRTREYKRIKKKKDNLADVIKYEAIARNNDSILHIMSLPEAARVTYFEEYIVKLKEQEEILRKKMEAEAKKQAAIAENAAKEQNSLGGDDGNLFKNGSDLSGVKRGGGGSNDFSSLSGGRSKGGDSGFKAGATGSAGAAGAVGGGGAPGTFYFYNPSTLAAGKQTFKSRWGSRQLTDNWRVASEMRNNAPAADEDAASTDDVADGGKNADGKTADKKEKTIEPKYTTEFYLTQLPKDQKVLDSLAKDRNFAYYQLGTIYKEKFKEYERAADKLEKLLQNNPEERLVLPSMYNLYKIYEIIDPAKAQVYKDKVLSQYPDSRYAEIIKNPTSDAVAQGSPEAIYASLFKRYEAGEIRELIEPLDQYIETYTGEEIASKYDFLKAKVTGRLKGLDEYKKALNYVALTYPNSYEGKQADEILKKDVPVLEKLVFGAKPTSYKIMFKLDANDPKIKPLTEKILQFIKDGNNNSITLSNDLYNETENILVIHGLINRLAAVDAVSILKDYKSYKVAETPVIISTEDYKVVQIKKNYVQYLAIQ
ncbi:tetratricopeptide repeat protein [Flavobacterium sp. Sd200]|uniref:type IX secretion system periplasmic lipoprotein PorW/SprE n=1 Tax=Flavobacterium sp. Sd200 TaxID=2692211 RepID=UPI001371FB44|nr:tetratricopeptide repeat protein [Flavobacterium sp. Sd200]MXN92606.1 tetratricopeptide repeat protein [Flavobacterium sp. Sd200]